MQKFNDFFGDKDWARISKLGQEYLFSKYESYNKIPWIVIEEIPLTIITQPWEG